MKALDGSFLDGSIHALNLPVGPGMLHLGQAMLNGVLGAGSIKDVIIGVSITGSVGKLDAVIGQYRMNRVRHGADEVSEKLRSNHLSSLGVEFGESELGSPVDSNEQVELALSCLHLGNVDMEVTDWIALELLLGWLIVTDFV